MEINFGFLPDCSHCKGTGKRYDLAGNYYPEKLIKCDWCNGNGFEMTLEGKQLVEFIEKVYGIKPVVEV